MIPHERFNQPLYSYDIGLIQVNEKIKFNGKVQPIELVTKEVPAGTKLLLFGWGKLSVRIINSFSILNQRSIWQ